MGNMLDRIAWAIVDGNSSCELEQFFKKAEADRRSGTKPQQGGMATKIKQAIIKRCALTRSRGELAEQRKDNDQKHEHIIETQAGQRKKSVATEERRGAKREPIAQSNKEGVKKSEFQKKRDPKSKTLIII